MTACSSVHPVEVVVFPGVLDRPDLWRTVGQKTTEKTAFRLFFAEPQSLILLGMPIIKILKKAGIS